ncbi:MAG: HAD hydrolase family protein [Succinivibrio sp.]|nr:HAD hydrolase family protein [Succinivibrio sp.]
MATMYTCYGAIETHIFERLKEVSLTVFDIDGTLTDGGIYLGNEGEEFKRFYCKDGYGIASLVRCGLYCAVITGRSSQLVRRRCEDELKMQFVLQGVADKAPAVEKIQRELGLRPAQTAVMGDDLNDLPMMQPEALKVCPSDAHPYLKQSCDLTLHFKGGCGAARELCDLILMAHGLMTPEGCWA